MNLISHGRDAVLLRHMALRRALRRRGPSVAGTVRLRKLDAQRRVVFEGDWFPNLFTDIGMDRIATGAIGTHCRIGTGNTAPANADTALVAQVASTSTTLAPSTLNAGAPDYETEATVTYEFALGAINGNMAEIGLGWSVSTAATLATRALIVDGVGSPTTITVLSSEILQVVYRITAYPNLVDGTGTVVIGGVTYDYGSRAAFAATALAVLPTTAWCGAVFTTTGYSGAIGAVTGAPAGTTAALTAGSFAAYTPGTFYRDFTVTAALAVGNVAGGLRSIVTLTGSAGAVFYTQHSFASQDSPTIGIPKDNTKTMSLTFRQHWSRH